MTIRAVHFRYLDALRESGATNMFGAGRYLAQAFGLSKQEAGDVLVAWMKTFSRSKTAEQRAVESEAL